VDVVLVDDESSTTRVVEQQVPAFGKSYHRDQTFVKKEKKLEVAVGGIVKAVATALQAYTGNIPGFATSVASCIHSDLTLEAGSLSLSARDSRRSVQYDEQSQTLVFVKMDVAHRTESRSFAAVWGSRHTVEVSLLLQHVTAMNAAGCHVLRDEASKQTTDLVGLMSRLKMFGAAEAL
jgi:hypothetical protein